MHLFPDRQTLDSFDLWVTQTKSAITCSDDVHVTAAGLVHATEMKKTQCALSIDRPSCCLRCALQCPHRGPAATLAALQGANSCTVVL